jgi:hypothetical protein
MTKIALTAAALLVATGAAFAGSDNYGSANANQPAVTAPAGQVDNTITGSIRKLDKLEQRDLHVSPDQNQPQSGQGIWGR